MKRFLIVTNQKKDPELAVTKELTGYLEQNGASCTVLLANRGEISGRRDTIRQEKLPEGIECAVILGGDGTMIRAADDLVGSGIPIVGVNLGTLGYLAEVDRGSVLAAAESLLNDRYLAEDRMMLRGTVYHGSEPVCTDIALNDIVVTREDSIHVINIVNYVNGKYLNTYRADGEVISTPTGSTGYSLSVGGPIISPPARLFVMSPIAAHALNTRSIILPAENRITIEIGEGRSKAEEQAVIYFDGDRKVPVCTGDRIEIVRSERDTRILKIKDDSFLETLRRKMSNM